MLLRVLAATAFLALGMFVCTSSGPGSDMSRITQAASDARLLACEWGLALATGSPPESLHALVERPDVQDLLESSGLDPWGQPYWLSPPDVGPRERVEVASSGPDRIRHTEDDIRAPIPKRR